MVHVRHADLDVAAPVLARLGALLSPEEAERAARFRFPRDRARHVAAHGLLRAVLGDYLGLDPEGVEIGRDGRGKPRLTDPRAGASLSFNLSHSQQIALIAITLGDEVGADVEQVRQDVGDRDIAGRFFAPAEREWIDGHEGDGRLRAFYRCWTAKEAVLKASGEGLTHDLRSFSVVAGQSGLREEVAIDLPGGGEARYALRSVPVRDGFEAAVAVHACKMPAELAVYTYVADSEVLSR